MNRLDEALQGLQHALTGPAHAAGPWRQLVRERLAHLAEELAADDGTPEVATDPWLAARTERLHRERHRLLARVAVLTATLEESPDPEAVRAGLRRLVHDVEHHESRAADLAYDDAGLDVGGSD